MRIQILKSKHENLWYHNKILNEYEIDESKEDEKMYFLSKKELKKMKKARHLNIGILKEDCIELNDDDNSYSIENILKSIDEYKNR